MVAMPLPSAQADPTDRKHESRFSYSSCEDYESIYAWDCDAEDGEAKRNDDDFAYVSAWEFKGVGERPALHKEPLELEYVKLTQRSHK